jgi:hypothetical protein
MVAHITHISLLRQMPCGLSSVRRALRVLWQARMCGRVRQGNAVDLALCTLLHLFILLGNRTRRRARLFRSGPYVWSSVLTV